MKIFFLWVLFMDDSGIITESINTEKHYYGTYGHHLCIKDKTLLEHKYEMKGEKVVVKCQPTDVDYFSINRNAIHIKS